MRRFAKSMIAAAVALMALGGATQVALADGTHVNVRKDSEYGAHLTDAQGMALYAFTADRQGVSNCHSNCADDIGQPVSTDGAGRKPISNCYGECASVWAPATAADGMAVAGEQVDPELLGTTKRKDGTVQLTYNGMPLYRFAKDQSAGDTSGQEVEAYGGEWYLVAPNGQEIEG